MRLSLNMTLCFLIFITACPARNYHVPPGTVIAIQFVNNDKVVKSMAAKINPQWAKDYKYIKGFYWEHGQLIVLSSSSFNPDILAHELYHVVGVNKDTD